MMELKNYNDVSIYLTPLCDDNIILQDISEESGFKNAYTTDKNRPYLENKVFLVYDSSINTVESLNRFCKFKELDTLHNIRYVKIDKKHYMIYCFNNPKYQKDINNLSLNGKAYSLDAKLEINRFWANVPVPELSERLFLDFYKFGDSIEAEVPEEDYYGYDDFG